MNNSKLFKQAHKIARETVAQVGDYQIAFKLALIDLRGKPTTAKKVKAVLCNLPDFIAPCVLILVVVLLGGGFGGLMAYHGLVNSVPVMYVLGSATIAVMVVMLWNVVKTEMEEFKRNYHYTLKM